MDSSRCTSISIQQNDVVSAGWQTCWVFSQTITAVEIAKSFAYEAANLVLVSRSKQDLSDAKIAITLFNDHVEVQIYSL